jgi:hypothetical protein
MVGLGSLQEHETEISLSPQVHASRKGSSVRTYREYNLLLRSQEVGLHQELNPLAL